MATWGYVFRDWYCPLCGNWTRVFFVDEKGEYHLANVQHAPETSCPESVCLHANGRWTPVYRALA